jgi:hypothetical protein
MLLALSVARNAARKVRPGGTLLFMGGTGGRRVGLGLGFVSAVTRRDACADRQPRARAGPGQSHRRRLRRHTVVGVASRRWARSPPPSAPRYAPIRRVVGPADLAALALHIMTNTALTGATYDVDGGYIATIES